VVPSRLAVRALGEGPYELVLRCEGAGEQRFSASTLETLARDIARLAPFTTHTRPADKPGVFYVDTAELVRHSATLAVEVVPVRLPAVDKAERNRLERAAHERALARAGELLRGLRAAACAPPGDRGLAAGYARGAVAAAAHHARPGRDGTPILTDGHHRLAVARETYRPRSERRPV
jgi:hypothetical protein